VLARVRGSRDGVWVADENDSVHREEHPDVQVDEMLSKKEVRALGYFIQKKPPLNDCCRETTNYKNLTVCHKCGDVHRYDSDQVPCWSSIHGPVFRGSKLARFPWD
jgi:hypothetical protein